MPTPPRALQPPTPMPAPARPPRPDERLLAAIAHLGIIFGFLGIGFVLGLAISGVIWLLGKRSRWIEVHAEQAGLYQLLVFVLNILVGAGLVVAAVLMLGDALGIAGLFGLPSWRTGRGTQALEALGLGVAGLLFAAWYVGTILLGIYAAVRVLAGRPFWYPLIGPWVRRRLGEPR
jgi:uncharacterized Tic20 family protein